MNTYIKRGRFEEFVTNVVKQEHKRLKEQAEKDEEQKLWSMYIHSMSDKSFIDWKKEVLSGSGNTNTNTVSKDMNMTDDDIKNIIDGLFS